MASASDRRSAQAVVATGALRACAAVAPELDPWPASPKFPCRGPGFRSLRGAEEPSGWIGGDCVELGALVSSSVRVLVRVGSVSLSKLAPVAGRRIVLRQRVESSASRV
jgi:hypothetical protein